MRAFQIHFIPLALDDFGFAAGGQKHQQHRDARFLVNPAAAIQRPQKGTDLLFGQGRVVGLGALLHHAHGWHRIVLDQSRIDGVLEDAPQVIAQVACDLRRALLDHLQLRGQFEPRDAADRSILQCRQQVIVDLAVALLHRRRSQVCRRRCIPVRHDGRERSFDSFQLLLRLCDFLVLLCLQGGGALGYQQPCLCMEATCIRQADFRKGAQCAFTFDAVDAELVAPQLRAIGLDEQVEPAAIRKLVGALLGLGCLDLDGSEHWGPFDWRGPQ